VLIFYCQNILDYYTRCALFHKINKSDGFDGTGILPITRGFIYFVNIVIKLTWPKLFKNKTFETTFIPFGPKAVHYLTRSLLEKQ